MRRLRWFHDPCGIDGGPSDGMLPPDHGQRLRHQRWTLAAVVIALGASCVAPTIQAAPWAEHPAQVSRRWWLFLPLVNPTVRPAAAVQASVPHGFYNQPITVTLSTATEGATIVYTLDGSVPGEDRGEIYRHPLIIDRTTVLRATALRYGYAPAPVTTQTYVFTRDVIRQPAWPPGLPQTWGTYPPGSMGRLAGEPVIADYGMDPRIVDDPRYRGEIEADLRAIPSISLVADPADLFDPVRGIYANPLGEGMDWERPASVEFLPHGSEPGFQIDCGVRIAGSWSRLPDSTLKHSFSLRFRSRYGTANLQYPVFPGAPVTEFDVLRLRGGQTDSFHYFAHRAQYTFDQWARDLQRAMGWDSTYGRFVHLYLNGLYWGLYNLTEEPTAAFAADHLGGVEEDYEVIKDNHEVEDGSFDGYAEMLSTMSLPGLSDRERYERLEERLDLVHHADYILLEIFTGNRDWPGHNYRAIRNRRLGLPWQFYTWDMEKIAPIWALDASGRDATDPEAKVVSLSATAGVDGIHGWLSQFIEYRVLFADRVRRHLFGSGALTPQALVRSYAQISAPLDGPIVAESARWGDAGPALRTELDNRQVWLDYWRRYGRYTPQSRDLHWRPQREWLLREFLPQRTAAVLEQLCVAGLFPPVVAPEFEPGDGASGAWLRVTMRPGQAGCPGARTEGIIYYTLDGSDPREPWSEIPGLPWSGRPSACARRYEGPITLTGYTPVRARLLADGQWSALTTAHYNRPRLAFTELMYHPIGGEDYEFLEIQNREPIPVDLSGMYLTGVMHTFPTGTVLQPGEYAVLARDAAVFHSRYPGVRLAGVYDAKLANEGETIALWDRYDRLVTEVTYDDEGFWPLGADGGGWSLVIVDPDGNPNDPENWRASTRYHGSPGQADPAPSYQRVVVNEVLAQTAAGQEDAIELHNLTDGWADIGGWYLSDDRRNPKKFRLPSDTLLAPRGYKVFYAHQFGADPRNGFGLSGQGETVVLSSADRRGQQTGYMAGFTYGPAEPGISWGRYWTTTGVQATPLQRPTFGVDDPPTLEDFRRGRGAANSQPLVGPLVISEIMYWPTGRRAEYVEIHNPTERPIAAYAETAPSRRWRLEGGVTLTLPPGLVVPPGGYVVIAGVEPARFREQYGLADSVPVIGPFVGQLADLGSEVRLLRPVVLEDGQVIDVLADRVAYRSRPPWPTRAAAFGASLERLDPTAYGNEPANWSALSEAGTPGRPPDPGWRLFFPRLPNG